MLSAKNVKYLHTVSYKNSVNISTVEHYLDNIPVYLSRIVEGAYVRGYNDCLDDLSVYIPTGVIKNKKNVKGE